MAVAEWTALREKDGQFRMPIALGIACENCGTVYLVNGSMRCGNIDAMPHREMKGMFSLTCTYCRIGRSFHKEDLKPYVVSAQNYETGYARRGAYCVGPGLK
jgi:hypothetical protein